ncbi:MAG: D-alanine--poly(phosphoribitol) ligase subunit DltC [Finegoldia magna]|uniref:D-alanyl carrier protein n=1 Tax=Finegoldia magna TaxID=1260 RepID=A0A943L6G7_FINMA|nr:D-alanine--poly(phosphoribitol) ligase subunit DltC [Finegoldia magna]MBS5964387.1 D-alanine--poly(phosphoribitol) ligase subunit DltC [Finegoldia magna]
MEEKFLDILEDICGDEVVREDLDINMVEEGLIDSLDFIELIVAIEDEFGVKIEPSEYTREEFDTPNKIINIIKSKM